MDMPLGEDASMLGRWYSGQAVVHIMDQRQLEPRLRCTDERRCSGQRRS